MSRCPSWCQLGVSLTEPNPLSVHRLGRDVAVFTDATTGLKIDGNLLVHGQVTIIFVVSVCLFVCLSVCLFVCLCRVFTTVFDPIWIKLGHMLHVRV